MPPIEEETSRFLDAWMQVRQMVQASNFNRFRRAGLSATQFMTLNMTPKVGITLSELSRRLNLSTATLHATVNSLEERGLIQRTRDDADGRKVMIRATKDGEELQNSASREFHAQIAGLFAKMSKTRREGLLAGLEKMVQLKETSKEANRKPSKDASKHAAAATLRDGGALRETRSSPRARRR